MIADHRPRIVTGTSIGHYEIVGWLGAGGMGDVYRARDRRIGRDVAIKLIAPTFASDPNRVRRFEQEAQAAGQLNHPNILAVFDVGVHDGAPYIVSELLEGESLRSRLHDGALPPRKAIDFARQIAEGLAAAHEKNIVHRDVKPDNLFITRDGRIKILDFGIAKLTRPADERAGHTGVPTETEAGTVVGTASYMSPEQVRGTPVDHRSDIFSFGAVLLEMLTGRAAFTRETSAETMTAILKDDPPLPAGADISPALVRIVSRCLEKTREMRFQSARDLAFGLDVLSDTGMTASTPPGDAVRAQRSKTALIVSAGLLSVAIAAAAWLTTRGASSAGDNPLAAATFTPFTNWEGAEEGAEISPDGKFVAFLADADGEYDVWMSQVGTGHFTNLTAALAPLSASGAIVRKLGFSSDGAEIWFNPDNSKPLLKMPLTGGDPRPFLQIGANTPAWSADGLRLVYFYKPTQGDPMYVADRSGANARQLMPPDDKGAFHNNNPAWSPDSEWIYFVRGADPQDEMNVDIWRLRASGGSPERLTEQHAAINFLAPLDTRTLLYTARAEDWSGPWLWALDVERKVSHRIPSGIDQFTSIAASRDGRRLVATVAHPTATLWQVPLLPDRLAVERDAQPYPLPVQTGRALAPRFGGSSLFYLSARGPADGLWKARDGQSTEVWRGVDGALFEPPAVSPDGQRVAIVLRQGGTRRLVVMSSDGTNSRTVPGIDIEGAAGQSAAAWSPDGTQIVVGGRDARGLALFKLKGDGGGEAVRLVDGRWSNPVWSPDGKLIVYAGRSAVGRVPLYSVTPEGTPVDLPPLLTRPGGYRFLPNSAGLVYLPEIQGSDFWLFDFATRKTRPLTALENRGGLRTFDIAPDGTSIVFDRSKQNSNIVLIDVPK